jgi:hypothetical protein
MRAQGGKTFSAIKALHDGSGRKGKPMNIEISTREYQDLLDILHIADVILAGHHREEDMRSQRHRALIQKLYGYAQGEGLDQLISYNETLKKYAPTPEFEENSLAHPIIHEFGDHLFWDELISLLTMRDAAQTAGGMDRLNAMSVSERLAVEGPIRQRYIEEISMNGVANLVVIERFNAGPGMPTKTSD